MNLIIAIMCLFAGLLAFSTSVLYANPFATLIAIGLMVLGVHIIKRDANV